MIIFKQQKQYRCKHCDFCHCCWYCCVGWHCRWDSQKFGPRSNRTKKVYKSDFKIMLPNAHHIKFIPSHREITRTLMIVYENSESTYFQMTSEAAFLESYTAFALITEMLFSFDISTVNAFRVIWFSPLCLLMFTRSIVLMRSSDIVCLFRNNNGCETTPEPEFCVASNIPNETPQWD